MRHQRADGRLPGSIQGSTDGCVVPQFDKIQGFCVPWSALNMYYWLGEDKRYLYQLADCLERFDAYLWKHRESNGDGLLESWCIYDTGEDNAVRCGDALNYALGETPLPLSSVAVNDPAFRNAPENNWFGWCWAAR